MNIPPAMSLCQPNMPSPMVLPDELIVDILSLLPVKSLTRLRCVSKSWNTLISDPSFVNMHLQISKRNAHLTLMWDHMSSISEDYSVVHFPVRRLLENPSTTVPDDHCHRLNGQGYYCGVVGSCNGLLCLLFVSFTEGGMYRQNWLCFWNPATRIRSEKLGYFGTPRASNFKLSFGYDNSAGTYKVVMSHVEGDKGGEASWKREARVFSLGDNSWRNIQSFPVDPLCWSAHNLSNGVYLSGTLNWLALRNYFGYEYHYYYGWWDVTVEQFVIVSLNLSSETYAQLLLPRGFDEVPCVLPNVVVLMDCLCFSHDFKGTDLVVWQMKEYGVQESWTQLLKISYQNLQIDDTFDEFGVLKVLLLPLCLSDNGDTLILASDNENRAIIYNWRDNRVERTRITNGIWWLASQDYVESLVSTC